MRKTDILTGMARNLLLGLMKNSAAEIRQSPALLFDERPQTRNIYLHYFINDNLDCKSIEKWKDDEETIKTKKKKLQQLQLLLFCWFVKMGKDMHPRMQATCDHRFVMCVPGCDAWIRWPFCVPSFSVIFSHQMQYWLESVYNQLKPQCLRICADWTTVLIVYIY